MDTGQQQRKFAETKVDSSSSEGSQTPAAAYMSDQQPLLPPPEDDDAEAGSKGWRKRTAEILETKSFRTVVIVLVSIDSVIILADLSYSFLSCSCTSEAEKPPLWLEILTNFSLFITYLFLMELLLCAWAFGPLYYSPFRSKLHFCDGSVIIMAFVIDVVLKGRGRKLAGLIILLRLIRFVSEAAVGVAELNEGTSEELHEVKRLLGEKTKALYQAQQEIQMLKLQLSDGA